MNPIIREAIITFALQSITAAVWGYAGYRAGRRKAFHEILSIINGNATPVIGGNVVNMRRKK